LRAGPDKFLRFKAVLYAHFKCGPRSRSSGGLTSGKAVPLRDWLYFIRQRYHFILNALRTLAKTDYKICSAFVCPALHDV